MAGLMNCGTVGGRSYDRLCFGDDDIPGYETASVCSGCGRLRGELHLRFCYVERCPRCTGQLVTCGCFQQRMWPWIQLVCVH